MKMPVALAVLATLAVPVSAAEHLVRPDESQQRLVDAEVARTRDLALVESFVTSSEGSAALARLGLDSSAVRTALSSLSDADVQELAARAAALQADPVAGVEVSRQTMWIGAIALAAILLIILIA